MYKRDTRIHNIFKFLRF